MGRIVDLCAEVAAEAEEGTDGLALPPEAWDRFRAGWTDEDIEDALGFVHDSLLLGELVEAADNLSAHLVEVLNALGQSDAFERLKDGKVSLSVETVGRLSRRVTRLEEILEAYREDPGPERAGFDALRKRLMNVGIENEMWSPGSEDDEDGEDR
jgi:hypothetical protein